MGTTESCCSDKDEKKAVATIEIVSTWPVTGETEAAELKISKGFSTLGSATDLSKSKRPTRKRVPS